MGAVMNEVGIPIKTIETWKPVAELVHNAFGYGLLVRNMRVAEGQQPRVLVGGQILERWRVRGFIRVVGYHSWSPGKIS